MLVHPCSSQHYSPLVTEITRVHQRKMDLYSYKGLFSYKRNEILTPATIWMDRHNIMLSETTQIQEDKICRIILSKGSWNRKIHRQDENKSYQGCGRGEMQVII